MLSISSQHTLHDITNGQNNFLGNVHIQSQQTDFYWSYPTQEDLDNGQFNFQKSSGGHAMFQVKTKGTGLVVLKSDTPIQVRIWSDPLPPETLNSQVSSIPQNNSNTGSALVIWIALLIFLCIMVGKKK